MHPLDGPRLRVKRATVEIERLRALEVAFRDEARYDIVKSEISAKTDKQVYRVKVISQPSLEEWGVWVGEIAHNLRSALDGVVFQLARLNGAPMDTRDTQFPIFRYRYTRFVRGVEVMGFEGHRMGRRPAKGSGRYMICRLRPEHQSYIESLQPYRRNGGSTAWGRPLNGRWNMLYRLKELNDADKHRLIQLVAAKPGAGPMWGGWGDAIDDDVIFGRTQIVDGAEIIQVNPRLQVTGPIMPLIAFWQGCKAVEGVGLYLSLSLMAKQVSAIVEHFEPDFD